MSKMKEWANEQKAKKAEFEKKHPKLAKVMKYGLAIGIGAATVVVGDKIANRVLALPEKDEDTDSENVIEAEDGSYSETSLENEN